MGLRGRTLAREITVVLVLKLIAIAVIWGVFFNPGTRPDVGPPELASRLLPAPALPVPALPVPALPVPVSTR